MAEQKSTDLTELSAEDLAKKKTSLKSLLGVIWGLCGIYIIYLVYRIVTMESGESVGDLAPLGAGLAVLASVSAIIGGQFGKLKAEEKRRAEQA